MKKQSDWTGVKQFFGIPTAADGKRMMTNGIATELVNGVSQKPIQYNNQTPVLNIIQTAANEPPKMSPAKKPGINWLSREGLSAIAQPIRRVAGSPLGLGIGIGALGFGLGSGLWKNIIQTGGSLGRYPLKKLTGMSDEEYDEAMEDLAHDNRYRWLIPGAIGLMLGGGYLYSKDNFRQEGRGLFSWTPKTASMHKQADELFSYGGYVPDLDFSQVINAGKARDMFSNDPNLQNDPYVRNMGISIINDAARRAGFVNPTLGNIYDSTANKIKSKLSWQGVTGIAANTMLANATAHLFTSALGAVMPLSNDAKRNIIDAGTWATAITSILK